jgi:serine/threonine protein kinase
VADRFTEYLIFEFAEHELASILQSKIKFEAKHAKCIIKQLFEGLVHLEQNRILHRDLKPSNILLNKHGVLKIIDFGIARYTDCEHMQHEKKQYTRRVTTPLYQAPELFFGEKLYDHKIDVWAAGCILFELLTLQPLFPTNSGETGVVFGMFKLFGLEDCFTTPEYTQAANEFKQSVHQQVTQLVKKPMIK